MKDFIQASIELAKAVEAERISYMMMGECPDDDIAAALKQWKESYFKLRSVVDQEQK